MPRHFFGQKGRFGHIEGTKSAWNSRIRREFHHASGTERDACLRVTELEDAVKSLTDGEWRSRGAKRPAIGPAYGRTIGNQFPGWREKPRGQVWGVFHLISNSRRRIPGEC